jgi:hypothetical protein
MRAFVVYESLWGNTAAVARAIAEGMGPDVHALSTAEATGEAVACVDLVVAGAPVFAFHLSSDKSREDIRRNPPKGPAPDLSHPSLRSWLAALPSGRGRSAAFDTQVKGPFGKGAPTIAEALEGKGYARLADPIGFVVKGKTGPLRDGELERARAWGADLARLMEGAGS